MKIFLKISLILIFITTFLPACNDEEFLENRYIGTVTDFSVASQIESLVAGAYWLASGEINNMDPRIFSRMINTLETDVAVPFTDAGAGHWSFGASSINNFYNRVGDLTADGSLSSIWRSSYAVIFNCNKGIDVIENEEFDDPNNWETRLKGEFLFLRAWAYYQLSRVFVPPYEDSRLNEEYIPIRTKPTSGFADANKARGTMGEFYELMVSSLQEAIDMLPEEPRDNDPDRYNFSRATKSAAEFMLARIAFEMQDWGLAEEMATAVIEDPKFDLSEEPIEAWNKNTFERPREVIWYYQWIRGDGVAWQDNSAWKWPQPYQSFNALGTNQTSGGTLEQGTNKMVALSYSFLNQVGWTNPADTSETEEARNDLRYQQLYYRFDPASATPGPGVNPEFLFGLERPTVWINKFYRSIKGGTTNEPILRLPEMYLTRAIINFLGGNGASQDVDQAVSDINAIRERAGLDPVDAGTLTADLIHQERLKEMAFEGDRLRYLQALRIDIPGGDRNIASIPWNSDVLYYPLQQNETDFNTSIE